MSFHIIKCLVHKTIQGRECQSWQEDSPQQAETDKNTQFTAQNMRSKKEQPEILKMKFASHFPEIYY